jgi:hypothetical protein
MSAPMRSASARREFGSALEVLLPTDPEGALPARFSCCCPRISPYIQRIVPASGKRLFERPYPMKKSVALGIAFSVATSQVLAHDPQSGGPLVDLPQAALTVVSTAAAANGIMVVHTVTDEVLRAPPVEKDITAQS